MLVGLSNKCSQVWWNHNPCHNLNACFFEPANLGREVAVKIFIAPGIDVFEASGKTYGSRRMSRALRALGYPVGRYQARSLMRKLVLLE